MKREFDIIVVGAGIIGLAHAYWAKKKGYRVAVFDRSDRSNGASVLNFGFITVTGQEAGKCWNYASRTAEIWKEVISFAGIESLQTGLCVLARRELSENVIDAFLKTDMAEGCEKWSYEDCVAKLPIKRGNRCGLYSPHEIRVESKDAIPQLVNLLRGEGVEFFWNTQVTQFLAPVIQTNKGSFRAQKVIVCPGDVFSGLSSDYLKEAKITRCKLQMMRVKPKKDFHLPHVVMSDLGLARYSGYADLPEGKLLGDHLDLEQASHRNMGVHLIVTQSKDGSLIVGDSHEYTMTPDNFNRENINRLILDELDQVLDLGEYTVEERWNGIYTSHTRYDNDWLLTKQLNEDTHLVLVTAGNGASTSFGIAEATFKSMII